MPLLAIIIFSTRDAIVISASLTGVVKRFFVAIAIFFRALSSSSFRWKDDDADSYFYGAPLLIYAD